MSKAGDATYTPDQCADSLEERAMACQFCNILIRWGRTVTGKRAPFDREAPHPNHFITCPEATAARAYFRRRDTPPANLTDNPAPPVATQATFLTPGGRAS